MQHDERVRRVFILFHVTLGLLLLVGSIQTILSIGREDRHALVLGSVEAVAAGLFLIPRTLRIGAILLLAVLAGAVVIHLHRGEWPGSLLIYAAAVAFVWAHGSAYSSRAPRTTVY